MYAGIDIGYDSVKLVSGERRIAFRSIVGRANNRQGFSLFDNHQDIILQDGEGSWLVGTAAMYRRFAVRDESVEWYTGPVYRRLFLAGLGQLTSGTAVKVVAVTGLPVAFYESGKEAVRELFSGVHRVELAGRAAQRIEVTHCRVIPQPFGAVLSLALTGDGRIADRGLAEGPVGVIDIGGKTTNLLTVRGFREVSDETTSVNIGGWDAAREVRRWLQTRCPGLDLQDYDLIEAIKQRQTSYRGEQVDLKEVVEPVLEAMAEEVIASAVKFWKRGDELKAVLVAGGGAHLLGDHIRRFFPNTRVVDNPRFANATGYYKFAVLVGSRQ